MTKKQRMALERFIGRTATLRDVQIIEALCATRRRALLRAMQSVELGEDAATIKPGRAGAILR